MEKWRSCLLKSNLGTDLYKLFYIGILLNLCSGIEAQVLPDLAFQNVTIWEAPRQGQGIIQVLEDSQGYLWMTSSMGVYRYDGKVVHSYFREPDSMSISENYTELLFEDSQGNVWVGTISGGIDRYVRATDHFVRVVKVNSIIGHASRICEDASGIFWIAGGNGLFSLDLPSAELTRYIPETTPKKNGYGFRDVIADAADTNILWVGGLAGTYQFNKSDGTFRDLNMPAEKYMLMDAHQTLPGELWGGSWFGGVVTYSTSTSQWHSYIPQDFQDGRWYNVVKAILPMDGTRFWVAGGAGFGVFDRQSISFGFYPFAHKENTGLDSSFSYSDVCRTQQGNIVVTHLTGFCIATPRVESASDLVFPPVVKSIEIEGKPFRSDTVISFVSSLYLDEREKDIAITLATPGNYSSATVTYSYRMTGYDKDWQSHQEGHIVRYTNLPQGTYRFEYRAKTGTQDWLYGHPVRIEKAVVFFMKPWFYLTLGAISAGMIFLLYRLRVQRIRNEAKLKTEFNKKIADTEMAVLRSQMNPHFMFNSLNSIKYYILNEETENANKYLTKFSKLMRLVLKNSQSKLVNLSDELEALNLYIELESLRFKEDFNYMIHVDDQINQEDTYIPPLIIQPYVENAIWHGLLQKPAPGNLTVAISREVGFIRVAITDDGIGCKAAEEMRSKSATKKSFGTKITRDRIALVKEIIGIDASVRTEDLQNADGSSSGTRVVIEMPYITGKEVDQLDLN